MLAAEAAAHAAPLRVVDRPEREHLDLFRRAQQAYGSELLAAVAGHLADGGALSELALLVWGGTSDDGLRRAIADLVLTNAQAGAPHWRAAGEATGSRPPVAVLLGPYASRALGMAPADPSRLLVCVVADDVAAPLGANVARLAKGGALLAVMPRKRWRGGA